MTLAQDYLQRGVVYGEDDEMKHSVHRVIIEHLSPIGEDTSHAKSYAEQFIFDDEVPSVVYQIVEGGHVSREAVVQMARLPSESTWVEWPVEMDDASGCKLGILFVDKLIARAGIIGPNLCGLFFVMRTGKDANSTVACFGCIGMPLPLDLSTDHVAVAFWKDYVAIKGCDIPEDIRKDMKAFAWDAIDALFLIMTPRVCEVRHVEYSAKANRRRKATGKLPIVEYKRMLLKVGIGTPRYVTHGGPVPLVKGGEAAYHKRLHRVIGHFRTYRAHREAPLVSFVPEHWRGDESLGVVLKTRHVQKGGRDV